jgi:hypothetical protein
MATSELELTILKIEDHHKVTIEEMIGIFLAIAVETNKVEACKDRKDPEGLSEVGQKILKEVKLAEEKHGLTQGESMKFLLGQALNMNKYAIRHERHPDDPDKKGDEA